jgi:cysteine desulfurase family protein (TIGR01976 family)
MTLDLAYVRSQFPALASGFAFFDNAGGSQVLKSVADRISEYLLTTSVQTGASYDLSVKATERLAEARAKVARLVNAARPEEVVFGPSTTVLMRFLATAMARQFAPGDEIVLTVFDHESNIGPWLTLEERGVVFKFWSIDPETFSVDLGELEGLMTERTKLVCVTHASNILGTIMPVADIARAVHARGAKICVDAVAYAPHRAVDVAALGVDYYVFSFYKTYGPHFAVMYGRHDSLLELDGLYHYFYGREKVPMKLEPGNPNYELAWGCGGIVDYLDTLGGGTGDRAAIDRAFADIAAQEEAIGERLLSYLRGRNDVRIVGACTADRDVRVPTISFKVDGCDSGALVREVDRAGVGIRYGDFHSRRLVEHLGLTEGSGVVRVSMVHYNTLEEVDRLVEGLDRALS